MNIKNSENIAIQALTWMSTQPDLLESFIGACGASVNDLKKSAADPAFLGAVLDFVLTDDRQIMAFCDHAGLPYDAPMQARAVLPGGMTVNWT